MSSRQERFNQKKKKMDQALHGSEIEFDEPVEPKKNKQQESMDNALLDLKIAGEEYCQAIQESVEAEAKEEEEFSSFAKGRSVFELFLYNWAREDRWMIQAYIIITLLIPVGLVWWKIENKACGIFMFLFLGFISWVFIALLSPFVEFFIESLIKSNIVWHQVRLKSYNPLGSIVIGLLNLVNWFFAKGSFVLVFLLGAFLPFLNSIDRTE